jgi:hypothetical protein
MALGLPDFLVVAAKIVTFRICLVLAICKWDVRSEDCQLRDQTSIEVGTASGRAALAYPVRHTPRARPCLPEKPILAPDSPSSFRPPGFLTAAMGSVIGMLGHHLSTLEVLPQVYSVHQVLGLGHGLLVEGSLLHHLSVGTQLLHDFLDLPWWTFGTLLVRHPSE